MVLDKMKDKIIGLYLQKIACRAIRGYLEGNKSDFEDKAVPKDNIKWSVDGG